jgi:drug/metabolite transporter (DMT)-like permease
VLGLGFVRAAGVLGGVVGGGGAGGPPRAPPRRDIVLALALGAGGYALQAGGYFSALQRLDASLVSLLVYTFPAMVAGGAVALGRERLDARKVTALVLALGGLALVVGTTGTGRLDPAGAALAIGAAIVYSVYILVSDGIAARLHPVALSALVCTGAAVTLTAGTAAAGQLRPGEVSATGWLWLVCLAAVSTVGAITMFFAGLRRVGPTTASVLATVEPLVTVVLAFLVFGDTLGPAQLAGGALVVAAVPALAYRRRGRALDATDATSTTATPASTTNPPARSHASPRSGRTTSAAPSATAAIPSGSSQVSPSTSLRSVRRVVMPRLRRARDAPTEAG